jgi:magnesium-transporting ATPase (P-type)
MKSSVVELVKRNIQGAITLAIGDGANDVSMISMADVGVGLYGEEGSQAAMSSDYAMGEFQYLRKMLLFHGRINYIRIGEMIIYFFYKNFLFTIPQFLFAFNCGFSGQTLYDDAYVSLFNMVFTALPLLFKALMEQDISSSDEDEDKFLKNNICKTYYLGRESQLFNLFNFLLDILMSLIGALVIYYFIILIFNKIVLIDGYADDLWIISTSQYTAIIIVIIFII